MQTGWSSTRRALHSRAAENEQIQTRSQALVRRRTWTSGAITGPSLISMLKRTSGQAASRSASTGMGSVPPIRAVAISASGSRDTRPGRPVTRSRVRS